MQEHRKKQGRLNGGGKSVARVAVNTVAENVSPLHHVCLDEIMLHVEYLLLMSEASQELASMGLGS